MTANALFHCDLCQAYCNAQRQLTSSVFDPAVYSALPWARLEHTYTLQQTSERDLACTAQQYACKFLRLKLRRTAFC